MKKELAVFTLALGLASTAPAFAGEEKITPKKQPVKMTEQQLDKVAGGLVNVVLVAFDVVDIRNNEVLNDNNVFAQAQIPVAVLGVAGAAQQGRLVER
jgi:hypothetical protein